MTVSVSYLVGSFVVEMTSEAFFCNEATSAIVHCTSCARILFSNKRRSTRCATMVDVAIPDPHATRIVGI